MLHLAWSTSSTCAWVKECIRKDCNYRPTQEPQTTDYICFLWIHGMEAYVVFRNAIFDGHEFRTITTLRFVLMLLLLASLVGVWFSKQLCLISQIALTLFVAAYLNFLILGFIMVPDRKPQKILGLRLLKTGLLLQYIRWLVLLPVWLGAVPIMLIWTEGRAMQMENKVVWTLLCAVVAAAATAQCIRSFQPQLRMLYGIRR